ncbi:MAG: class I SAM-dependent methyltransferase [Eubacteriales bacterium]
MSAYETLAGAYDGLTYDVDYEAVADYAEKLAQNLGKKPNSILDLACGTGSLSLILAERGYEVMGLDISPEMLTEAMNKVEGLEENRPLFICQPMEELELPYEVDMAICCLDGINYVTDPADCQEAFNRVYDNLSEGGLFLFDINSAYKLENLDGQVFLDENDDTYCVWRTEFDQDTNICYYGMDIFKRDGQVWQRSCEEHQEYAYSVEQLTDFLKQAGFASVAVYGCLTTEPPAPDEQRIYILATKEQSND